MSIGDLNAEDLEGLVGRELDGRYVLDKFIDRGGFGAVYRGIDKKFNQAVAVKVGFSYREFMKEAKLAAEVRHDHIVQVSDYGNDNGLAYLVMEFLHGDDLEKLFKKQGYQLTPDQMRMFVTHVGDALAHAHGENLIHRDLKPRNIILKQNSLKSNTTGSPGKFVLLDFGIAAKLDAEGTQRNRTQDGAGTLEYMAPELLKVKPTTTIQSDIYAFGVLLYQMLTGRVPFPQSDASHLALAEIVHSICHSPPPRFAEVAPDRSFPAAVEKLVMQCLEKDSSQRPQSMSEVKERFLSAFCPPPAPREDFSQTIRPGGLSDTGIRDSGQSRGWQSDGHPPPRSMALRMIVTFVLIAALLIAGGEYLLFPATRPYPTLTVMRGNEITQLDDGASLDLAVGDAVTLTFGIEDLAHGIAPGFAPPEVPEGVQVEMNNGPMLGIAKNFVLSVPDLNSTPRSVSTVTFRATIPGQSSPLEKTISLNIRRPQPWLPQTLKDLGFQEALDSRLCRVGGDLFASVLERRVGKQTVRFRLIPSTEVGDRRIKSFYAMENLVSNSLFNEFAKAEPTFEFQARKNIEREWEVADDFPVTRIYVLEAQRFAQWLGGRSGSLPTTMEWELSAGYYDFLRVLQLKFGKPPSEIPPEELRDFQVKEDFNPALRVEVWIGLGPTLNEFHEPHGNTLKDCSPYGCRYNRLSTGIRPTELTATLVDFSSSETELRDLCRNRIPDKSDKILADNLYKALLRGLGSSTIDEEVRWVKSELDGLKLRKIDDLNDAGIVDLLPDRISFDSYIGFRVVLLTDTERK